MVIFTIDDPMVFWRKEYPAPPGDRGYPWLQPILLEHGTAFVWRCNGPGSDDWNNKHGTWFPQRRWVKGENGRRGYWREDPGYTGTEKTHRRVAVVCRCTRAEKWFAVNPPHRQVMMHEPTV